MNTKPIKIIGWIFLALGIIGGLMFIFYLFGGRGINQVIMGTTHAGGSSNAPTMLGLFALAGAYLVTRPDGSKSD